MSGGDETHRLFVTELWRADLLERAGVEAMNAELEASILSFAEEDVAGRAWCKANGYGGYTSYASLDDLPRRAPCFGELKRRLDREVAGFAGRLAFDLGGKRLKLDSLWVNVLKPGAAHSGHVHPHSVISGTYYVRTPPGSSAIRFEDPRLPLMMAAPPRDPDATMDRRPFVYLQPAAGTVLLWESWLRHEVPANAARSARISVSFNYGWR
jgi:uncharacterized protein (TIGR02466 family)